MVGTMGCETARWSQSQKTHPSPDRGLQLDPVKSESLVIGDQHAPVNTFPGLVHTARHTTKVGSTQNRQANLREAGVYGRANDWGEVVTR